MTRTAWLLPPALLVWGFAVGQPPVGAALAALWLLPALARVKLPISDRLLLRAVDLSSLLVAGLAAAFVGVRGLPAGLLGFVAWLPAALLPLALIGQAGAAPLRVRHLAYRYRGSRLPEAERPVETSAHFLALVLLSATTAGSPAPWLFAATAALLAAWLFLARPGPLRAGAGGFAAAALIACGFAVGLAYRLEEAQAALEDWAVGFLSGVSPDPYRSHTGIGELGRIKLSDRIVWRLDSPALLTAPLLLRDGVYVRFDGSNWTAQRDAFKPLAGAPQGTPALRLHGDTASGRAIVPLPAGVTPLRPEAGQLERNGYGIVRINDAPGHIALALADTPGAALPPGQADLKVPPRYAGLLGRLPELARLAGSSEAQRLAGLEAWFANGFRYTLFLGDEAHGTRDLERFLLTDRAGHCEYFASATVILARALGLPARYVTGYSVQEWSPVEHRYLVRRSHAHAWAELFVDGRWVEVDTTPAVWLAEQESRTPFWQPLADLVSYGLLLAAEWRGFGGLGAAAPLGALLLGAGLIWALARRLRGRPWRKRPLGPAPVPPDASTLAWRRLEAELAALGLARRPGEPPRAWLKRLAAEGRSVLDGERLAQVAAAVEELYRRRYGARADRGSAG